MSFKREELEAHCDEIIKDPAIRNRIIVLCEGDTQPFKPAVHAARIKDFSLTTQDSAFYYRAIPEWWRTTRQLEPNFYACGNQKNVLDGYFYLKAKHQTAQPQESYLNSQRLFALVDIDLANRKIGNDFPFADLASIYQDLYANGKVSENCHRHAIWVTGLLHKEAYFLAPELQNLLNAHQPAPIWNGNSVDLAILYQNMVANMAEHQDIRENFSSAKTRIQQHPLNNADSIEAFQIAWLDSFTNPQSTEQEKHVLAYILLTFAKSKFIWEQIKPDHPTVNHKNYRDELCLKIGRQFYAEQPRESELHLPRFFSALATRFANTQTLVY